MPNMQPNAVEMPHQDANVRNKNFNEVALGYTPEMAKQEAERCLQCKNAPCVKGCPVNVQIPEFIDAIAEGDFKRAQEIISETNSLGAVCGRVCPQETQCQAKCVRGIKHEPVAIGRLERFACDYASGAMQSSLSSNSAPIASPSSGVENGANSHDNGICSSTGKKVAVVGGGPAGLACAGELVKNGYDITIFEALHEVGGVLMYGIPEFRLPKSIVQSEVEFLKKSGVKIETNVVVGKTVTIDELKEEYDAIFIGSGAGLPNFMGIEGENLNGVYSANEFLTRINLMKAYEFPENDTPVRIGDGVAVIGGGNVAMDAARCAKRMGTENVYIIYRRTRDEMPARAEEIEHAQEEGIKFRMLNNPTRILGDENGYVCGIEVIEMELGEPDESGRRSPKAVAGSEMVIDVNTVVVSIGQNPNPLITSTTPDLEVNKKGCIVVDEQSMQTSMEDVYAGGDVVTGAATVILAMGAGRQAAKEIIKKG